MLPAGVQVNAVAKVTGRSWRVQCAGRTYSGNTWYRINNVNGRSTSSRYGVSYVYSATALYKSVSASTKYAACDGVALRTKASTSATRKAVVPRGTRLSPRPPWVPAWDDLTADARRLSARQQEV